MKRCAVLLLGPPTHQVLKKHWAFLLRATSLISLCLTAISMISIQWRLQPPECLARWSVVHGCIGSSNERTVKACALSLWLPSSLDPELMTIAGDGQRAILIGSINRAAGCIE